MEGGVYLAVLENFSGGGGGIYTYPAQVPPGNRGELTSVHENCCLRDPTGFHVTHLMLWIPGTVGMVQNP